MALSEIAGLQIALVHLLFNVAGTLLFYPVPFLRRIPLHAARWLADQAIRRRGAVFVYLVVVFLVLPLTLLMVLR